MASEIAFSAKELDFDNDRGAASKVVAQFLASDPSRGQGYLNLAKYQYSTATGLAVIDECDVDIVSAIAQLEHGREQAWASFVQWLEHDINSRQGHFFNVALSWGIRNQDNGWLSMMWTTAPVKVRSSLSDAIPFAISNTPIMCALMPAASVLACRVVQPNLGKNARTKILADLERMFQWAGSALLDYIEPSDQDKLIGLLAKRDDLSDFPALRSLTLRSRLGELASSSQSVSAVRAM